MRKQATSIKVWVNIMLVNKVEHTDRALYANIVYTLLCSDEN